MDILDKTDLQILRILQDNARLTTKEIAAQVNLSTTPDFERLKRLETGGYIKKYIAILDAEKLNRGFTVFCSVKLRRINREVAVEYSFFLAIPTMFAASFYSLYKGGSSLTHDQWIATGVGFVTAFLVALGVIAFFMEYIRRRDFKVFGFYRIVLGIILLLFFRFAG